MDTMAATLGEDERAASPNRKAGSWCESNSVMENANTSCAGRQSELGPARLPKIERLQLRYLDEASVRTSGVASRITRDENAELCELYIRPFVQRQLALARQSTSADSTNSRRSSVTSTSSCQSGSASAAAWLTRTASEATTAAPEPVELFRVGPPGSVLMIDGARFVVEGSTYRDQLNTRPQKVDSRATAAPRAGMADEDTTIFVVREVSPTLDKICVLPYDDTLPTTYDYDLFKDYVCPFFMSRPLREFRRKDAFVYQGVRFRVAHVQPADAVGRVGLTTEVHCDGKPMQPKLRDLLGTELRHRISVFPGFMQAMLGHYILQCIPRDQLRPGGGLDASAITQCEVLRWHPDEESTSTCRVCLGEFEEGDELRRLACTHVFHVECVDQWLNRSPCCPVCKQHATSATGT